MRGKNRKSITSCIKFPQFTTMNVIDGQAGLVFYSSLFFYSLTINNILNIVMSIAYLVVKLDKTKLVRDIKRTTDQTVEIAKGNADDSYGTNRIFIWKETLKVIPKYWLHGVGIDNFYYAFDGKPIVYRNMAFDKAHNEYLQVLITQGIFALILYLMLFGFIVCRGIKNSFKNKETYLILPVIGFLVHIFFAFNVIELAPIFYMALGLCSTRNEGKYINE